MQQKKYDLIAIGSGSATSIVIAVIEDNPNLKVALIDKDEPGGICLTRGCIPSKLLLYPAELIRTIERSIDLGIHIDIKKIDFQFIMKRMQNHVNQDIDMIRKGLSQSKNIDYYRDIAQFVKPYVLKVGNDIIISSDIIFLCTGSKPLIPKIKGLENVDYHTSDTILNLKKLPKSIVIAGGGYIAAEYGHFFSAMGSKVTIIGRNKQFLPSEEKEISLLVQRELEKHLEIITGTEITEITIDKNSSNDKKKTIIAKNKDDGKIRTIVADEILVATGRASNSEILNPKKGEIATDKNGWIKVNEFLETSKPNIWAFGDANGQYQFKHKANYEAQIVYNNAILKEEKIKVDYSAVPRAIFTYPEVASVGLNENDAIERFGKENILIGSERYQDTAKGIAMNVKDYFVKIIVKKDSKKILGACIVGTYASILIQEIINIMYTKEHTISQIVRALHIHPALSEVVQRACSYLMTPDQYHHILKERYKLEV